MVMLRVYKTSTIVLFFNISKPVQYYIVNFLKNNKLYMNFDLKVLLLGDMENDVMDKGLIL